MVHSTVLERTFLFQELKVRRLYVVSQLKELQDKVQPILDIMGNDEVMQNMENMRDSKTLINYLSKDFKVINDTDYFGSFIICIVLFICSLKLK